MMLGMTSRWSGIYKPWLTRLSSYLRFPFHKVAATNIKIMVIEEATPRVSHGKQRMMAVVSGYFTVRSGK